MILVFIAITVLFGFSLLLNKRKREIPFGKLVSHKKWYLENKNYITEVVKFRDSVECIKYYNKFVTQFNEQIESYDIDSWTTIEIKNGCLKLFRYGNNIKLIRKTTK